MTTLCPTIDAERSRRLARLIDALPSYCYFNCANALRLARYAKATDGLSYCEGWTISMFGLTFEHAWFVTDDRTVVDPTLALQDAWPEATRYFAGEVFDRAAVKARWKPTKHFPFVYENRATWDAAKYPGYQRAFDDTYRAKYGRTAQEMHEELIRLNRALTG